jgi:hypothetical protein
LAKEVSPIYLVSTCDILGLSEVKSAARVLSETGFDQARLSLVLNQIPGRLNFPQDELEKLLAVPVRAMLPECRHDFEHARVDGKRLGESRKFQNHIARLAADITGIGKDTPVHKSHIPFFIGALRNAKSGIRS